MKLTGTVLRSSSRKVNSSGKETYVTNLLVLDPENSSGTNYAVEVWGDKPHKVMLMSEIALTVVGVVNKSGGVPALRAVMAAQSPKSAGAEAPGCGNPDCGVDGKPMPQAKRCQISAKIRRRRAGRNHPFYHSVYDPPLRVALKGGS